MAILRPEQLAQSEKRIRMLIAGYPGIGKTTLALSAPRPLHIDVDRGIDRVGAAHRAPFIQPKNYQELLDDLKPENLQGFDTLVVDTGGQMIKLMGEHGIRQDAKRGKRDGSLSLQGYGYVSREFARLMDYCFYTLQKHVIVLFHAKEEKDGENTRLRLMVEGSTKDLVWQPMDLGGFMLMHGKNRVLSLGNDETHFGKCCHGVNELQLIPELTEGRKNDFLTMLFAQVNAQIVKDAEEAAQKREAYDAVMAGIKALVNAVDKPEAVLTTAEKIKDMEHALTSLAEGRAMLAAKAKELGYRYDKEAGMYVEDHPQSA
jgi:hypothetical protein